MPSLLLWFVTTFFFATGLIGIIVPVLPGIVFIFLGIFFYAFATAFTSISLTAVVMFGLIAVLAWLISYGAALVGARVGGGHWWTLVGTLGGCSIGFVVGSSIGLLIGSFIGALIGALYEGFVLKQAVRVAILSVLGILGGVLLQFVLGAGMIVAFLLLVLT